MLPRVSIFGANEKKKKNKNKEDKTKQNPSPDFFSRFGTRQCFHVAQEKEVVEKKKKKKNVAPQETNRTKGKVKVRRYDAATTAMGAGDEAWMLGALCISTSGPLLLLETLLPSFPFSLFSLLLPSAEGAAESSVPDSGLVRGGAVHRGISQTTPVKLLSLKPPLAHLRQGLPERSRARRPALMAPWLALGPSLWADGRAAALLWSIVPSSLHRQKQN